MQPDPAVAPFAPAANGPRHGSPTLGPMGSEIPGRAFLVPNAAPSGFYEIGLRGLGGAMITAKPASRTSSLNASSLGPRSSWFVA